MIIVEILEVIIFWTHEEGRADKICSWIAHEVWEKVRRIKMLPKCNGLSSGNNGATTDGHGKTWEESILGRGTWAPQVYTYWRGHTYWRVISETSHRYLVCLMAGSSKKRPGLDIHKWEYRMRWSDDRVLTGKSKVWVKKKKKTVIQAIQSIIHTIIPQSQHFPHAKNMR